MKPTQNALGAMRDLAQTRFGIMSIFVQKGSGRAKIRGRMMTEATLTMAVAQAVAAILVEIVILAEVLHQDPIIILP